MRAFAEAPTSSMTASAGSLKASPVAPLQRQQHRTPRRQQQRMQTISMAGHGRFFVGGNWKCNGDMASTKELVAGLNAGSFPKEVEVVVAAPFVYVPYVAANIDTSKYAVAAQNCWVNKGGAFTGEVTPAMIKDVGAPWVVLGHSERRALCGETDEVVGAKVKNALEDGLKVLACIGETLEERESGVMWDILDGQMRAIAANVTDWDAVVIAYEPVWAIGTGVVATPAQAQEVHAYLRNWLDTKVEHNVAERTRILYGGSVNDANCAELATQSDIDGFLVGGASLKASSFLTICNAPRAVAA